MLKGPSAYKSIGEVAKETGLQQHVLRFWETRFTQIQPVKSGRGRRLYRPEDVQLILSIKHLLQSRGYTIRGVQKLITEQGVDVLRSAPSVESGNAHKDLGKFIVRLGEVRQLLNKTRDELKARQNTL